MTEAMKTSLVDWGFRQVGMIWMGLRAGIVLAMVMGKVVQAQAVMTSFSGTTAPGNWELVPWDPTGTYWFDRAETANTLTIAGAVNRAGESLTTVQMKSGIGVGVPGYLIFNYEVEPNQATGAELSVYRLHGGGSQLLARLTGSGTYRSDAVFGSPDRVAFVLSSTLEGKPTPAYVVITPIPEPEEWAVVVAAGLGFYLVYCRGRRKSQFGLPQSC